jgi:hypothetical protein
MMYTVPPVINRLAAAKRTHVNNVLFIHNNMISLILYIYSS